MERISIGTFHYKVRQSYLYRQWRKQVLERDNYTCQKCGTKKRPLHTHHIKPLYENLDLIADVDNGLTVCARCHKALHRAEKTDNHKNAGKTVPIEAIYRFHPLHQPDRFTISEAVEYTGIEDHIIRYHAKKGSLASEKTDSGLLLFTQQALDEFKKSRKDK